MHVRFQPSFDDAAYRNAKAKANKSTADTKSNSIKRSAATTQTVKKKSQQSGNVVLDSDDEFPPIEELLRKPVKQVDLTKEPETPEDQPQESTIEQPLLDTYDGSVIHGTNTGHRKMDPPPQIYSSEDKDPETSPNVIKDSSMNGGKQHNNSTAAQSRGSLTELSNNASSLSDVAYHASSRQGSNGPPVDVTAPGTSAALEQGQEPRPCNTPGRGAQSSDSEGSNGATCPELPMDDGQVDSTPADEWDAEIIGEEHHGYMVAWKPTLIPKENASADLIKEWEAKKAGMGTQQDTKRVSRTKKRRPATQGGTRVAKAESTGVKRGTGRPRKAQPA
ncbi:hypothetical protein DL764_001620 [Monosporascus ibericus]|uniref:Uncharacterized protein n=1 Tax=Monosporascus ibericus TaxID=155417 RepID=A0A4Q4TR68_9PEZI|nr:hypothetical protein DL764_001620 [Monosporascus ibericus]